MIRIRRTGLVIKTICLSTLLLTVSGCYLSGPPDTQPSKPNFISLNPQNWIILYSSGMPQRPTADPDGAWSFSFPNSGGHVNYVQTPFTLTTTLRNVTLAFMVQSDKAEYHVLDKADHGPATFHIFIERQNDDLQAADGRWWADPSKYNLGSDDNHIITVTVPLTADCWTDVYGKSDPQSFSDSLKNVGWIGVTFGGQFFWGHGVNLTSGSSKYVLVNFFVN